jgi:hypothetical protein
MLTANSLICLHIIGDTETEHMHKFRAGQRKMRALESST